MGDRIIGEALGSDFAIIHPATRTEGRFVRRAHWGSPAAALIRLAVRYGSTIPQIHSGRRKNQPSSAKARRSAGTCQGWLYRYRFLITRHSHGGIGLASAHSPRFALLASRSSCASVSSSGAYLRYHHANPAFTSSRFNTRLSVVEQPSVVQGSQTRLSRL